MPKFGIITTVAGTGAPGYSGDNAPAFRATLNNPFTCQFDNRGNLWIADSGNNVLRRIEKSGVIRTMVGTGKPGTSPDGTNALRAMLNEPVALAIDSPDGKKGGNGDTIYIVDHKNRRVRAVDNHGVLSTVAGNGVGTGNIPRTPERGDGGAGKTADLREPHDCALDGRGGLLIADVTDGRIRRLDLRSGIIETFLSGLAGARAIAVDTNRGLVYICEREGNRILQVDMQSRRSKPFAGSGAKNYTGDGGSALNATLNGPKGLCLDRENLYIVDTENHAIRCVDIRSGRITTVAGGRKAASPDLRVIGDGILATSAGLNRPHGVCVGADGALYIADTENHRIRKVLPV